MNDQCLKFVCYFPLILFASVLPLMFTSMPKNSTWLQVVCSVLFFGLTPTLHLTLLWVTFLLRKEGVWLLEASGAQVQRKCQRQDILRGPVLRSKPLVSGWLLCLSDRAPSGGALGPLHGTVLQRRCFVWGLAMIQMLWWVFRMQRKPRCKFPKR